jgi:hypothetical protein
MANNLDGRKAVGDRNRTRVFHYLDERGAKGLVLTPGWA